MSTGVTFSNNKIVNNASDAWVQFFGDPGTTTSLTPTYDPTNQSTWTLPEAYNGQNKRLSESIVQAVNFLGDTLITKILPIVENAPGTTAINSIQSTFEAMIMPPVPDGGIGPLTSNKRSKKSYVFTRKSIGFRLSHGFMNTTQGMSEYAATLAQMSESLKLTLSVGAIQALLNTDNAYRERMATEGGNTYRTFREHIRSEVETFNILRKNNGAAIMHGKTLEQVETYRGKGDTYIFPKRAARYITTVPNSIVEYRHSGPTGDINKFDYHNSSELSRQLGSSEIYLIGQFDADDLGVADTRNGRVNPLDIKRQIGEYFVGTYLGKNYENYSTEHRTIRVYDEDKDKMSPITVQTMIENCGRFDEDGNVRSFDDMNGISDNKNNNDPNKARDPFHYKNDNGEIKAARYMGNLNYLTFENVKEWVQTVLNAQYAKNDIFTIWEKGLSAARVISNAPIGKKVQDWFTVLSASKNLNTFGMYPLEGTKGITIPVGYATYPGFKTIQQSYHSGTVGGTDQISAELAKNVSEFIPVFESLADFLLKIMPTNPLLDPKNTPIGVAKGHESHYSTLFQNLVSPLSEINIYLGDNPEPLISSGIDMTDNTNDFTKQALEGLKNLELDDIQNNMASLLNEISERKLRYKLYLIVNLINKLDVDGKKTNKKDDIINFFNEKVNTIKSKKTNSSFNKLFIETLNHLYPDKKIDISLAQKREFLSKMKSIDAIFSEFPGDLDQTNATDFDKFQKLQYGKTNDKKELSPLVVTKKQVLGAFNAANNNAVNFGISGPNTPQSFMSPIELIYLDHKMKGIYTPAGLNQINNNNQGGNKIPQGGKSNIQSGIIPSASSKNIDYQSIVTQLLDANNNYNLSDDDKRSITNLKFSELDEDQRENIKNLKKKYIDKTKSFISGLYPGNFSSVPYDIHNIPAIGSILRNNKYSSDDMSSGYGKYNNYSGIGDEISGNSNKYGSSAGLSSGDDDSLMGEPLSRYESLTGRATMYNFDIIDHIDNNKFKKLFKDVYTFSPNQLLFGLGEVFLLAPLTKETLLAFARYNVAIPVDFLVFRPHCHYVTNSCIFVQAGRETGESHLSTSIFSLGDDPNKQQHVGSYSVYTANTIYNHKNVKLQPNVMITEYEGGRGVSPFKKDGYDPVNGFYGSDRYRKDSIFVCVIPLCNGEPNYESPMDIRGFFNSPDIKTFGYNMMDDTNPHYEGYLFENARWQWNGEDMGSTLFGAIKKEEFEYSIANTVVHQGHTVYYNPIRGSKDIIVKSLGHHGSENTYSGCKNSWSGDSPAPLKDYRWD